MHDDLFIAIVLEESHRAYLLNSQFLTIVHQEEDALFTSKQGMPTVMLRMLCAVTGQQAAAVSTLFLSFLFVVMLLR